MNGLGEVVAVTTPSSGSGWSVTVPDGKRWRLWGGSCLFVADTGGDQRNPWIQYVNGDLMPFACGKNRPWVGAGDNWPPTYGINDGETWRIVLHGQDATINAPYLSTYLPLASSPIWLDPGTVVSMFAQNMLAGDQFSQIRLLIEEVDA
jgi:hypothetical protein